MALKGSGDDRMARIVPLCDGVRTSHEIAAILDESPKYVQRVMLRLDLPRLKQAPRPGVHNPSYVSGRVIDRDGYVLVPAPLGHPNARMRAGRSYGRIYEHRLVMEKKLGRLLERQEIVDHIDGLRLHNHPDNLRLFGSNGEHLRATISGMCPRWSEDGKRALRAKSLGIQDHPRVHTYDRMKKSGDARLREILLTMLELGTDSPYLLGTHHHLRKAGIVDLSRPSLERELERLYQRYA